MDFNRYSDNYEETTSQATRISGQEQEFFVAIKRIRLLEELHRVGLDPGECSLLDVGCGVGLLEDTLDDAFGSVIGVDVAQDALKVARDRHPHSCFLRYDGTTLPFPNDSFDVSVAVCVMHHVPPPQWRTFLEEMVRVTKADGRVVVFEHNPLNPFTRLVVSRCEYDADASLLRGRKLHRLFKDVGLADQEIRYFLLFPWSGSVWRTIEHMVERVPAGAQYMITGTKVSGAGSTIDTRNRTLRQRIDDKNHRDLNRGGHSDR